jgi:hypothetical protein
MYYFTILDAKQPLSLMSVHSYLLSSLTHWSRVGLSQDNIDHRAQRHSRVRRGRLRYRTRALIVGLYRTDRHKAVREA